jgi:hypothetical protein
VLLHPDYIKGIVLNLHGVSREIYFLNTFLQSGPL